MYKDIAFLEAATLQALKGEKILSQDFPSHVIANLQAQYQNMNAGFYIAPEPQSFIRFSRHSQIDLKFMGRTDVHPVPQALYAGANYLRAVCLRKEVPITPFEVLGLAHRKRSAWRDSPDFQLDPDKVGLLIAGDIVPLWQVSSLIRQRRDARDASNMAPIIIQNGDYFYEPVLHTEQSAWVRNLRELKKINVFYSSGEAETADLLAGFSHMPKILPQHIVFELSGLPSSENSNDIFATGDPIKFGQTQDVHRAISPEKKIRKASDVFGPSEIPVEEDYSLEGNAYAKLQKLYEFLEEMGEEKVLQLLDARGFTDVLSVNIIINDGGLGFCLENSAGDQVIDLFSEQDFYESAHRLNPIQRNPGVELAEIKKTIGHETMMQRLEAGVRDRIELDPRFTRDDFIAYDGSVYMSVPLATMLESVKAGKEFDLHGLGVVSVYAGQKLKVTLGPHGLEEWGVPNTEHYLIPPGQSRVRADIIDWHTATDAPNVSAFNFLKSYTGVVASSQTPSLHLKNTYHLGMGMLGSRDALTERGQSSDFQAVKIALRRDFEISTGQGPSYWRDFQLHNQRSVIAQASRSPTNTEYLSGLARMFDSSRVVYIGHVADGVDPDLQKIITHLAVLEGGVRNQIFRDNNLVINTRATADILKLISWKQSLGLVLQKPEHLYTSANGPEDAAAKIQKIVRSGQQSVTGLQGHFHSDGQTENHECMIVTAYLSATNKNKILAQQAAHLGYLLAINGFSAKVGGGNEGLMKDFADGFNAGKAELEDNGYKFPNQLILIQCAHTVAIEKKYDGTGIFRSHADIHPRMADLQATDFEIGCASGAGGDQEIHASFFSRLTGLIDPQRTPFVFFNQQVKTSRGQRGVHDPYRGMFSDGFDKRVNASWAITVEEVVARVCASRAQTELTHAMKASSLAEALKHKMNGAAQPVALASPRKNFRPPFDDYLGAQGGLAKNSMGYSDRDPQVPLFL